MFFCVEGRDSLHLSMFTMYGSPVSALVWIRDHHRSLAGTTLTAAFVLGSLTAYLITCSVAYDIDPDNIVECISKNVKVIQANLDEGLNGFDANSFDYVVMTQTIQAMRFPHKVINEMLRIGREVIVTFPNLGHWKHRLKLLNGNIPVTAPLPNSWFETPNIHICTIRDFEKLCKSLGIIILERAILDSTHIQRLYKKFCKKR